MQLRQPPYAGCPLAKMCTASLATACGDQPLAVDDPSDLVPTVDVIRLDIAVGSLDMLVDETELERRRDAWRPPTPSR